MLVTPLWPAPKPTTSLSISPSFSNNDLLVDVPTAFCLLSTVCRVSSVLQYNTIITSSTMRLLLLADAVTALSFSPRLQKFLGGGHDNDASTSRLAERPELPGGTPMSLCRESGPTDLFNVTWVELTKQPLYM